MVIDTFSVCATGIGGLGVMWLSKVIADAACNEYEFVVRTESRGLSQRGGTVCSIVRFGRNPISPAIPFQGGNLVLALDRIEALRSLEVLAPDGWLISNSKFVLPTHVASEWSNAHTYENGLYDLTSQLDWGFNRTKNAVSIDLKAIAGSVGSGPLNAALLGHASHLLPIANDSILDSVVRNSSPLRREETQKAFFAGMNAARVALSA